MGRTLLSPLDRVAVTPVEHFRDGRFFNPGVPDHSFLDALKWMRTRRPGSWPGWIPSTPGPKPPERVEGDTLRVTFINHATVLLQTEGMNLLTDPVWSRRVSPVSFAGPPRHRAPGVRFEDLPRIDAILLSHNHYDHLDAPTLRRLAAEHNPTVFCPLGVAPLVRRCGLRDVQELNWWQAATWRGRSMHCVPAQHFSARTPFDRNRTLWCGWVVEAERGSLYFAGDTGFGEFFAEIGRCFSPIRLALLPIGAYEPEWFMGPVHMTPEQAVEARVLAGAATAIGIHFGTFSLADDGEADPPERLRRALAGRADADRFWTLAEGDGREIPRE
jgi:L-ascorbate metabolism protein UlaG (beta-lactamase superfamily)